MLALAAGGGAAEIQDRAVRQPHPGQFPALHGPPLAVRPSGVGMGRQGVGRDRPTGRRALAPSPSSIAFSTPTSLCRLSLRARGLVDRSGILTNLWGLAAQLPS